MEANTDLSGSCTVINTGNPPPLLDKSKLLKWVNETLDIDLKDIAELSTGAAYCQLWDMLFPGTVALDKVKLLTNSEVDFKQNFQILQKVFFKNGVRKIVPVHRLIKKHFEESLNFLQWFKHFFEVNYKGTKYDPVAARNGAEIRMSPEQRTPYSLFAADRDNLPQQTFHD